MADGPGAPGPSDAADVRSRGGSTGARVGRSWRERAVDWAIGAGATVAFLLLAAWLLWLSISRPADSAPPSAAGGATPSAAVESPSTMGPPTVGAPTPPEDLDPKEVWLGDVDIASGELVAAGTPLYDVDATGTDVVSGPDGLRAAFVDVSLTVPFDVVAAEIDPEARVMAGDDGEARIETTYEFLGRVIDIAATGTVTVVDGKIHVEPTRIDLGGPDWLSSTLGGIARRLVTIEHDIEGLPEGLVLQSVDVLDDGFRAHVIGTDILLTGSAGG